MSDKASIQQIELSINDAIEIAKSLARAKKLIDEAVKKKKIKQPTP